MTHPAIVSPQAAELARLRAENDKLRGLLAKGGKDCAYCGLPAEDIARCASGFPGCARMDDIMQAGVADENKALQEQSETALMDAQALRDGRAELVEALEPFGCAADDLDKYADDKHEIWESPAAMGITAGHLRAARALLARVKGDG